MVARGDGAKVVAVGDFCNKGKEKEKNQRHVFQISFNHESFETVKSIMADAEDSSFSEMVSKALVIYGHLVSLFRRNPKHAICSIARLNGRGPVLDMVMKSLEIHRWLKQVMESGGYDKIVLLNSETGEAVEAEIDL
jgi:hypothetical protein